MSNFEFYKLFLNTDFWSALFGSIGALLVFFFGLPPKVDPEGYSYLLLEGEDEEEKRKAQRYKKISYAGVLLISTSFLLQLIKIILRIF
jgi:hypothetical protein